MSGDQLPAEIVPPNRLLTAAEFHQLADVPPEVEWFANLSNPQTRRAYEHAVGDLMRFTGIGERASAKGTRHMQGRLGGVKLVILPNRDYVKGPVIAAIGRAVSAC